MSKIQVNDIVNHYDTGAPQFPKGIAVGGGATLGLNVGTGASIYSPSDNVLTLGTNNSERLRITSAGLVGIGLINPDLKLHVSGANGLPATSGSTPTGHVSVRAKGSGSSHGFHMGVSNTAPWSSWIQAQDANNLTTNYPLLLNPNGGNVGIGTDNPGTLLELKGESGKEADVTFNRQPVQGTNDGVIGQLLFENATDSVAQISVKRESAADDAYIQFATQTTGGSFGERLRITSGGQVLINQTSVGTKSAPAPLQLISSSTGAFGLNISMRSNNDYGFISYTDHDADEDLVQLGVQRTAANTGDLIFYTNGGNDSATEELRLLSSGGITFNGDTAAANALDDYEEGNFLPTVFGSTTAGTTTYSLQYGYYVKVGSLVHVQIRLTVATATGTGGLTIGGLPYISLSDDQRGYSPMNITYASGLSFGGSNPNYIGAYTVENQSYMFVFASTNGQNITATPVDSSFTVIAGGTYAANS